MTVLAWHEARQTYISCGDVAQAEMMEVIGRARVASTSWPPRFFVAMLKTDLN